MKKKKKKKKKSYIYSYIFKSSENNFKDASQKYLVGGMKNHPSTLKKKKNPEESREKYKIPFIVFKGLVTLRIFSAIFTSVGDKLCDFLFAVQHCQIISSLSSRPVIREAMQF